MAHSVPGVRAGFCPQSLKVSGLSCTCLAVSPFLQHLEPVAAMHKSALGWSYLGTRLGPACCKHLPKQNITQLKGAYCVPLISPWHSSTMSGFPGWAPLEQEEIPTLCKLSLCASSPAQMLLSPLGEQTVSFASICCWNTASNKHYHIPLEVWIQNELGSFRQR